MFDEEMVTRDEQLVTQVVILKLINGDLIIGIHEGYDDFINLQMKNPLIISAVQGYVLMTDYAPFLSKGNNNPVLHFNPEHIIFIEGVSEDIAEYYDLSVKYRNLIKDEMDGILSKSSALISDMIGVMEIARAASGLGTINDHKDTPIADVLNQPIEKPSKSVDGVIDFNKILAEALKNKKKDTLN